VTEGESGSGGETREKKASKKNENERHHPFAIARTRILWWLPSANGRFPLKSASHGSSFTNFTTKLYTTGVGREVSAIPIEPVGDRWIEIDKRAKGRGATVFLQRFAFSLSQK
jgi:hypothetical protein